MRLQINRARMNTIRKSKIRRINAFLGKRWGIKISRSYERIVQQNKRSIRSPHPLYVEFVGVPGVGKTTLYEALSHLRKKDWLHNDEYRELVLDKQNSKLLHLDLFYEQLAQHKLNRILQNDYDAIAKLRVLNYCYRVLMDDALIRYYNKEAVTILSDEGLFHNYSSDLKDLRVDTRKYFKSLIKGKALVYCYAPAETIAHQVLKRNKETGKLIPQHQTSSFRSLVLKIEQSLREKETFISFIQEYVPVLFINTSDPISENASVVNKFITQLQQNLSNDTRH